MTTTAPVGGPNATPADGPRTRGRPTRANGDATRQRCIDVAIRSFAEHGYARAGMRDIAERAGITASGLYNYFPSKPALYGAAWTTAMDEVYRQYATAVVGCDSLVDELHAVLDRSADLITNRAWIPTFGLTASLDARQPDLQEHLQPPVSVVTFLRSLAGRAVQRGEIDGADSRRLQSLVAVLLWGITAVSSYDTRALAASIDAAKWTIDDRFGPRPSPGRKERR